jgi:hypothetical protein
MPQLTAAEVRARLRESHRRALAEWIRDEDLGRQAWLMLRTGRLVELSGCTVGDALAMLHAPDGALVAGRFELLDIAAIGWPEAWQAQEAA